jgi:peroxiredoxin
MKLLFTILLMITSFQSFAQKSKEERKALFDGANKRLKESMIEEKVPKVGDTFPDLELKGKKVSEYLKEGALVVTFYRGGWCPYCVKQLKNINSSIEKIINKANLIAISPEQEKEVQNTKRKNKLKFPIISDNENKIARKLNLTFRVEPEVVKEYKALGIDLKRSQGNDSYELPMPATFVIGENRKILYTFADADYTKRASTEDIMQAIKEAQKK